MSARHAKVAWGILVLAAGCSHAAPPARIGDDEVAPAPADAREVAIPDASPDAAPAPPDPGDWDWRRARSPARREDDPCRQPSPATAHLECGSAPEPPLAAIVLRSEQGPGEVHVQVDRGARAGVGARWIGRGITDDGRPDPVRYEVATVAVDRTVLRAPGAAAPRFKKMILWDPMVHDLPEVK